MNTFKESIGAQDWPSGDIGCWRCASCHEMKRGNDAGFSMEDSIISSDPAWSAKERNKRSAWNGNFSKWCFACCEKVAKR